MEGANLLHALAGCRRELHNVVLANACVGALLARGQRAPLAFFELLLQRLVAGGEPQEAELLLRYDLVGGEEDGQQFLNVLLFHLPHFFELLRVAQLEMLHLRNVVTFGLCSAFPAIALLP